MEPPKLASDKGERPTAKREYRVPGWAAPPQAEFRLEVLKGGQIVENINLADKSHFSLGRDPASDIVLQHPSSSRKHAIIQFAQDGNLFIHDLGSTHGTKLNKNKIEAWTFCKVNVGDMITFGESTRLYIVCGPQELMPQEYESENLRNLRQKVKQFRPRPGVKKREQKPNESDESAVGGISWGMGEDAEEEDEEVQGEEDDSQGIPEYLKEVRKHERPKFQSSLARSEITQKDLKLFEKLKTKVEKIENMQIEIDRIRAKEMDQGGLTEGQTNTIQRNETRISQLKEEVDELENTIREKNKQRLGRESSARAKGRAKKVESDEDYGSSDDDFFDRTDATRAKRERRKLGGRGTTSISQSESSYGTLEIKTLETLERELKELEDEERALMDKIDGSKVHDMQPATADNVDSLDAYMAQTSTRLVSQKEEEWQRRLDQLQSKKKKVMALIDIARPALAGLRSSSDKVGKPPESEPAQGADQQRKENDDRTIAEGKLETTIHGSSGSAMMASGPSAEGGTAAETKSGHGNQSTRDKGPSCPQWRPACQMEEKMAEKEDSAKSSAPLEGMTQSDRLSADKMQIQAGNGQQRKKRKMFPALPSDSSKYVESSANLKALEDEEMDWVPPKGQTGDGRTALNDKFGY